MKKIFLIFVTIISFDLNSFGQNVVIQTNEIGKSTTQDNCGYRIAGICTTEDIGGVEVSRKPWGYDHFKLVFENYNPFTVNVIYEYVSRRSKATGTIVLRANEKKETNDNYFKPEDFKLIVRKL